MKIIVAIKQVPVRDSSLHIDSSGHWIDEDDLSYEINEPDAYALEEALQLKEKHGGEVVALLAGPERGSQTIREALAKGADRAIHIECDDLASLDTLGIASRLAAAIKDEKPDLILTGLQSDDLGLGQTGVVLAELLGIPHATIIMQVEVQGGAGDGSGASAGSGASIKVKRELEDGWFQHIEMPLPAVLTIQSGLNKLRYATLMGIKKAKAKEIKVVTLDGAAEVPPASAVIEKLYAPEKNQQGQIFDGDPKAAAAKLAEKLRFEARVI
jgi:electron transfer flavoprotein beta subunit